VLEGAVRAATGTGLGVPLPAEGQGFLLAMWSIVHGFAIWHSAASWASPRRPSAEEP
jgi:hypothetical protein